MLKSNNKNVALSSLYALRKLKPEFKELTDIKNIWEILWPILHQYANDDCKDLRSESSELIGYIFHFIPEREVAFNDLTRLANDADSNVIKNASMAMARALEFLPISMQLKVQEILYKLASSKDWETRLGAIIAFGSKFDFFPNKEQAFDAIYQKTSDRNANIRLEAAKYLAIIYSNSQKKDKIISVLERLSNDRNSNVRTFSKYLYKSISKTPPNSQIIEPLSMLDMLCMDILKSRYQKTRKVDKSEVNSKTLKFLKEAITDLMINDRIDWLDVGCGNGRCLEILDAFDTSEMRVYFKNLHYVGVDMSHEYFTLVEKKAKRYKIKYKLIEGFVEDISFPSNFDIISLILVLHEVDPIKLPFILCKMLSALKEDGLIVISDFNEPLELEKNIVIWSGRDIISLLENIGAIVTRLEIIGTDRNHRDFAIYRCQVKRTYSDDEFIKMFFANYLNFLENKLTSMINKYDLNSRFLKSRIYEILSKGSIDIKNISDNEKEILKKELTQDDLEIYIRSHRLMEQCLFLRGRIEMIKNEIDLSMALKQFEVLYNTKNLTELEYNSIKSILLKLIVSRKAEKE